MWPAVAAISWIAVRFAWATSVILRAADSTRSPPWRGATVASATCWVVEAAVLSWMRWRAGAAGAP
jgi:hypothetical protein